MTLPAGGLSSPRPPHLWWRPSFQLPGALILSASTWLGGAVARPAPPPAWDVAVLVALIPSRNAFLETASKYIEFWDGPEATPFLIAIAGYVVFLRGHRTLALIAVSMTSAGWLPGHFAKLLFPRERPGPETQPLYQVLGISSFPSGHTGLVASATVAALFVLTTLRHRRARIWVLLIGVSWTLIVGMSRLLVAVHYPTDVIGGIGLDGGMALILWPIAAGLNDVLPRKWPWLQDRRVPAPAPAAPPVSPRSPDRPAEH